MACSGPVMLLDVMLLNMVNLMSKWMSFHLVSHGLQHTKLNCFRKGKQ